MSGVTPLVDTLLATRLAQRLDLVPLKPQVEIAGPAAATRVEKIANDVRLPSRAALEQQLGVGVSGSGHGRPGSPPSDSGSGVILSAVARAVSAILHPQMGPALKIRGSEPLWPHSPPPPGQVLAARLAQTVTHSGLFYESHLQQFAAGLRSLEQMVREPQAGLALPSLPAASTDAAVALLSAARPGAGEAAAASGAGLAVAASAAVPGADAQAVRSDSAPLAAVYGRDGRPENSPAAFHEISGQEPDAKTPLAGPAGSPDKSNTVAAAIHPDAMALVRQQLELLSVPVFRWCGEAWPGTPMEWDIQEEQAEDAATSGGEATQPAWTTNLTMTLPTLKSVAARLTLEGDTLQVRLVCDEDATLAVLHEGRQALSRRFGPLGLQLTNLQVGMSEAEDGTGLPKS